MSGASPSTIAPDSTRDAVARPSKPPPTMFAIGGTIAFVAVTIAFALDWRYGIGLDSLWDARKNFGRDNPLIQGFNDLSWDLIFGSDPANVRFRERIIGEFFETVQIAVIASVLGALAGLPLALYGSVTGSPNSFVYVAVKNLNSFIRSVPDLVYAVFFVAAIGRGALPGILALFLLSVGVVAKLTSDMVDGIDPGPIEAARAVGATHHQIVKSAVLPQVIPPYVSFSLYVFEINLRGSTVLGFVGAGGIGQAFQNYYQRGWYDRLIVVVILFFGVVFLVDRISVYARRHLL